MRTSTRVSGTDAMADHVETLASRSTQADVPRQAVAVAPLVHAIWRFCRRKPLGALGGAIVLVMIVMAVFAPYIAHYTYDETIRGARMKPPRPPVWMGTDNLGRDIWGRVVYGARISVTVGFCAVLIANVLATSIGTTSGYLGGKYDLCVQRVVDAWQSFPFLVVILSIMAVLGPGLLNIILALGFFGAANATQGEDDVQEPRAQHGHDREDHDQKGKGLPGVHHPLHAEIVLPPEVAAGDPDAGGQHIRDEDRAEADGDGDAGAVQDPAPDVRGE